jgi:hypothetical protein
MKTTTVSGSSPLLLAGTVSLKDRVEMSLIFMVSAAVGEACLSSRGLSGVAQTLVPLSNGAMFVVLWVLPSLHIRNALRTLILGLLWSAISSATAGQISNLMVSPAPAQEVVSQ